MVGMVVPVEKAEILPPILEYVVAVGAAVRVGTVEMEESLY